MKRVFAILICVVLLLAGCTNDPQIEITPTTQPTTVPATTEVTEPTETEPPVPETLSATALADRTYVVLTTLNRDDSVEIVEAYDEDYYTVKVEAGYGLMEKRLIRMDGEAAYESWTGYAKYQSKVYNNYHLFPDGSKTLKTNTKLTVLDDLDGVLVVEQEGAVGYMRKNDMSRSYIQGGTGGGGGGADGGDISLGAQIGVMPLANIVTPDGAVTGKATVLADGAEIILGWFDRNDTISVINEEGFIDEKEGWYGIYHEGLYGYVRQNLIRKDTEEAYAQWNGYAKYQAPLYDNYYLSGDPIKKLSANADVQVLEDLGSCYLVTSGEYTGYMAKDMVSQTRNNYSGGGGGGGGGWTPPAL